MTDDAPEIDDPEDYADRARNTVISFLEHDLDDYEDGAERFTAEFNHLAAFAEDIALAIDAGMGEHRKSRYAEAVARYSADNKTSIIADIDEKLEEIEAGDRPMFDEVIDDELRKVVRLRPIDHGDEAYFKWVFDRGHVWTTNMGGSADHRSWSNFIDRYRSVTDHSVAFPSGAYRDAEDWDVFISEIIEERIDEDEQSPFDDEIILNKRHYLTPRDSSNLWVYDPKTGAFSPEGEAAARETLTEALGTEASASTIDDEIERLKSVTYIDQDSFDAGDGTGYADDPLVPVANGTLNYETGELADHSPEYRWRTTISAEFDPDAECPTIDGFLDEVTGSERDKHLLYEIAGFCLARDVDPAAFFMLRGAGRNGKSVYLKMLESLLGAENVTSKDI